MRIYNISIHLIIFKNTTASNSRSLITKNGNKITKNTSLITPPFSFLLLHTVPSTSLSLLSLSRMIFFTFCFVFNGHKLQEFSSIIEVFFSKLISINRSIKHNQVNDLYLSFNFQIYFYLSLITFLYTLSLSINLPTGLTFLTRTSSPSTLSHLTNTSLISFITMVLSKTSSESDVSVHSTFASRYVRASLPRFRMPENSIPKEAASQIINDELMLDGNPRLNLASFVTTWMEPECDKLIMASINKNYVDMDEYPVTTELQASHHLHRAQAFKIK
ncbi:hypothetical protein OIU77_021594 [Salix suchowensis]|nr:hypothetical protein OIU77_021594 [Salix suchowensis]